MCITSGKIASASGSSLGDASPRLTFRDPRSHVQNAYCVNLLTPLETPEHLSAYLRGQFDGWRPRQIPPSTLDTDLHGCRNKNYFMRGCVPQLRDSIQCFLDEPKCYGQAMFAKVFKHWYFSGLQYCDNLTCQARKKSLERSAPNCGWPAFRDALLTSVACWQPWSEVTLTAPTVDENIQLPIVFCLDVRGMLDVWLWAARLISGPIFKLVQEMNMKGFHDDNLHQLWQGFTSEHNLRATESSRKFYEHGFCVNRLWNVSLQSKNGIADIPYVVGKALEAPVPKSKSRHINCTEEICLIANENSTLVNQAHKCPSGLCANETTFPPPTLNEAFYHIINHPSSKGSPFEITAWRIPEPGRSPSSLCSPNDSYVAISHVWSDGTGVGMRSPGVVNTCLFEYFANLARQVSCDGIWWDVISIPTERRARAIAMDSMLENYEKAKVTIVHDQDLVEFEWKDDGSPAVAMILSSWFTRGWTAAELWASRGHPVKVLFKDPNDPTGLKPLIKDLDMDVLAGDLSRWVEPEAEGYQCPFNNRALDPTEILPGMAHMIATDILGLFRWTEDRRIPDLQAILRMLQTRTTSWARDRTLIAALMCLPPTAVDSTTTGPQMTQKILAHFGSLRTTEIVNHRVPMSSDGPWDWAPQSIFDLGQWSLSSDPMGDWSYIYEDGSIKCEFLAYEVLYEDVITEYRHHPALAARISVALSKRQNCLLLTTPRIQQEGTYILFQPVSVAAWTVRGKWIGCVSLRSPLGTSRRHLQVWNTDSKGVKVLGLSPPIYVFGKNRTTAGKPLPAMSFDSTFVALEALNRNKLGPGRSWCLSTNNHEEQHEWLPHSVYMYKLDHNTVPNIGREGPTHPCGTMLFGTRPENWVQTSFLSVLIDTLNIEGVADCLNHDGCRGTAMISWSFLCPENEYYGCWNVIPNVYTSVFHITDNIDTAKSGINITLGSNTFDHEIKEHLFQNQKYGKNKTYLNTCRECGKCDWCKRQ
ncbi:uncharacterized protein F4807DRAFT_236775 [Annulohypoxylon truncatum]|uniref:uncharacterized protein n=1 Tax=Annulohypoxylon truncatum TaxID=327061 RepID=UPI0020072D03|nr:uncharacterized protein F4807DRAFT_236775 [Annulohypoxylon truncatum]KAI1206347.1 hypothetical protein F4807DRAFT_236775 [Annulohypoxylon truncatum]